MSIYYLLKTKVSHTNADYLQIRDNQFKLIQHLKLPAGEKTINMPGLKQNKLLLNKIIKELPVGAINKIEL